MDRGDRIIGNALVQGKLSWKLVVDVLLRQGRAPEAGEDAVRILVEEGVLNSKDVVGLESTQSGFRSQGGEAHTVVPPRAEPSAGEPGTARLLTALAIPQWRQYRNLRFLGEGGMGRIYKGFDTTLRRMVALKFLRRMEAQLVARFMQEAQLQGSLEHPNICRVYEVGDWQGQAYIAMQFIKGETLDACGTSLSLREKVQVMEAAASAVHFAHRQGLIHRDLKPANIMVERPEGQPPQPYLLDFGLARGLTPSGFTLDGQIVGTYHFMAPEQARGDVHAMDRRTDVYALGATLYALLADKPPFWEVEGVEVLRRTLHEDPVPLGQVVPDLPADLETIAMKCLEKEPGQRYESARALAEDLRRFLDEEPILARRPTLRYRATKYARKHKAMVALSAAALLAVLTFGGIAAGSWATARTRARHAQAFGQEAERLEAMARYIHLLPAHDIRGEREAIRQRMRELAAQAASRGRFAKGPAAYALGRGHNALGAVEEAHKSFEEALRSGFDGPDVRFALGRTQGALFQKAMDAARRIGDASLRKAEEARARKAWLEPALANLQAGAGTTLHGAAFEQALLDFYNRRYDQALLRAREAYARAPWYYEAKRLEADILHTLAMEEKDPAAALPRLAQVERLLHEARRVAPSDPSLPLGIARVWRDHILRAAYLGQDGPEALEACGRAAEEALALDPEMADAEVAWANGWNYAAMGKSFRRTSARKELTVSIAHAEAALRMKPEHREALLAKVSAHSRMAFQWLMERQDPLAEIVVLRPLADRLLQERPDDPIVISHYASALRFRFTHLSQMGQDPSEPFQQAIPLLDRAVRQHPELTILRMARANFQIELAEYQRKTGLDPSEVVQEAVRGFEAILVQNPHDFQAVGAIGTAKLILADARTVQGENPLSLLAEVERQRTQARAMNPRGGAMDSEIAEARLLAAGWRLDHGEDPLPDLVAARTHLVPRAQDAGHQTERLALLCDFVEAQAAAVPNPRRLSLLAAGAKRLEALEAKAGLSGLHRGILRVHYHLARWSCLHKAQDRALASDWWKRLSANAPREPEVIRLKARLARL